jgi:hypothetical protein
MAGLATPGHENVQDCRFYVILVSGVSDGRKVDFLYGGLNPDI